MKTPTNENIWNEELTQVLEFSRPWRHGELVADVYKREEDSTYWRVEFCRSSDGETNELREGNATITRVRPVEVITINYVAME